MPAPTTYASRELRATRDGLSIYGQLFTPAGADERTPLPTLVCAHGFGANYLSCVPYAWSLTEHGFAVYCFDFCGGGYAAKSEGNPLDMTLATESADIEAVVAMLRDEPQVDPSRLFVLGEGQGAFAATLHAYERPLDVCGLVLVHPTFNLHEQAKRLFPTKKNIPASYRQLGMRVGRAFGEVAWDTNPYAYMQGYSRPVLILHGDEDVSVPLECAQRAEQAFPNARLSVVHHGRHVFRGEEQRACVEQVTEFLCDVARRG